MSQKKKSKEPFSNDEEVDAAKAVIAETETDALLKKTGIYYITGELESDSLKAIHQDILLKHLAGPKLWDDDIQLIINSPGGSVDEANSLLDLLASVRMDVRTIGMGTCASAAALLLASGTKGKRIVGPSTIIMIHRYSWGIWDKQHELVARRNIEDAIHQQFVDFWINHSKYKTKKDVEKYLLKTTDNWLTAKQAKQHGIIDHIAGSLK